LAICSQHSIDVPVREYNADVKWQWHYFAVQDEWTNQLSAQTSNFAAMQQLFPAVIWIPSFASNGSIMGYFSLVFQNSLGILVRS